LYGPLTSDGDEKREDTKENKRNEMQATTHTNDRTLERAQTTSDANAGKPKKKTKFDPFDPISPSHQTHSETDTPIRFDSIPRVPVSDDEPRSSVRS
jgi:hypothetical protein